MFLYIFIQKTIVGLSKEQFSSDITIHDLSLVPHLDNARKTLALACTSLKNSLHIPKNKYKVCLHYEGLSNRIMPLILW